MEFYTETKNFRVTTLVDHISNLENCQRREYKRLLEEAENCKRKADEYYKWKNTAIAIQDRFASIGKLFSLLRILGSAEDDVRTINVKLEDIRLEQLIVDGNIDKWMKETASPNIQCMSVCGENIPVEFVALEDIVDVQRYVDALYLLYKGSRDVSMYDNCLRNLYRHNIVKADYQIEWLKSDYRKFANNMRRG